MNFTEIAEKLPDFLRKAFVHDPDVAVMFNSKWFLYTFLIFLGIYIILADQKKKRIIYVTIFSLFFYYKSSGWHFMLLLFSTVVDYLFGLMIFMYQHEGILRRPVNLFGRTVYFVDLSVWYGYDSEERNSGIISPAKEAFINVIEGIVSLLDTVVDFFYTSEQQRGKQKFFLILSLVVNIGMLAIFKYTDFIIENINILMNNPIKLQHIALPVGISFFTFQTMSYTIDIYRKKLQPVNSPLDFAFYVSFFPQLVAGPIVRASEFIPQIRADIKVSREDIGKGIMLITLGLFKKAVISDYISTTFVDQVFEVPTIHTGFENLLAVYGYALQIFCDFSGYSDMAIGIGLLLGYRLPLNFNVPYQSTSIQEFWRRWHISLSSWLRDYLYISLGGNRNSKLRTYFNLLMTMLLGGLWHGASWLFIIWGALHGLALAIDRMLKDTGTYLRRRLLDILDERAARRGVSRSYRIEKSNLYFLFNVFSHLFGVFVTFHFVCFCWIFFRATSIDQAFSIINQILYNFHPEVGMQVLTNSAYHWTWVLMCVGFLVHFIPDNLDGFFQKSFVRAPLILKSVSLAIVIWIVLIVQVQIGGEQPFIYYQF
ncbi:MAG: MBOAT family protein [Bacteroidia bacterium]|nr:MBOAT family protein [Bacteroidia bacterium]